MRNENVLPNATNQLSDKRAALAPEILEALWVATEMRSGGTYAHSVIGFDESEE